MDASGGHSGAILAMQTQAARKEWRAVNDGSTVRDRISGDIPLVTTNNSNNNGVARMKLNSALQHPEILRNGRALHSGGGGSSCSSLSDSDHHVLVNGSFDDVVACQNGDDSKLYAEIQRMNESDPTTKPTSNGLSLDLGGSNSNHFTEPLEQHLHDVIRQREQLQRLEAELRAQYIARSEILRMQNSFDEQAKLNSSVISNLQEQLQDRENKLHEMEQQLEERERQLHANKREASEAVNQVWAKDGLLREQTNELTTLRREKEKMVAEQKSAISQFEAERNQLLSRLQEVEEQVQEKDRQLREMEEQHRAAQDALIYKDEQLREAQAWIQRAQEMDTFHATTNSSLHAELRDRTEQMNQLWLGQQRQLAEVERFHLQTIQRLRIEVAEAREQNRLLKNGGTDNAEMKTEQHSGPGYKDTENFDSPESSMGTVSKVKQTITPPSNNGVDNLTGQVLPVLSVVGVPGSTVPANPIPVVHQFPGQPQGAPAAPSQITQLSMSQFSNPIIMQAQQQLIHQQTLQQHSKQIQQQPQSPQVRFPHPQAYSRFPETKASSLSLHTRGMNQQIQLNDQQAQSQMPLDQSAQKSTADFSQFSNAAIMQHGNMQTAGHLQLRQHMLSQDSNQISEQNPDDVKQEQDKSQEMYGQKHSSQESKVHKLLSHQDGEDAQQFKEQNGRSVETIGKVQNISTEQTPNIAQPPMDSKFTETFRIHHKSLLNVDGRELTAQLPSSHLLEQNAVNGMASGVKQGQVPEGNVKAGEPNLLDEKALLACLVRAIPSEASSRIRISTTLPNRLGKMLAPLHWHDYKKRYGRLDEFISSHPKLFVVDGDFVHLREGAHAIISATTAVAKVAAATAMPLSNWPPTIAVTPVAHSQMQRARKSVLLGNEGSESAGLMVQNLSILQRKI